MVHRLPVSGHSGVGQMGKHGACLASTGEIGRKRGLAAMREVRSGKTHATHRVHAPASARVA